MVRAFSMRFILDSSSRLLVFIINILVARKLSVSDFGLLTYALSLANLLFVFTDMGMHLLILKEAGKSREELERLWPPALTLKFALSVAVFAAAIILLPHVWKWNYPVVFIAATGWMLGNSFVDFYQTFCNAHHDFTAAAKLIFASRFIVIGGVAALFALHEVSLESIVWVYMIGSVIGALIGGSIFIQSMRLTFRISGWQAASRLLGHAFPLGVANIFGIIYLRLDTIFLTWIKGSTEVGIYGAAYRVFEMIYAVPGALMIVATPLLSRAREEGSAPLRAVIRKTLVISAVLASGWLVAGSTGSPLIIGMLFGERYLQAVPLLRVLSLANVVAFFSYFVTYMLVIMGNQKRHALNQGICLIISALLNVILILQWGAYGAAYAVLATQCVILSLSIPPLRSILKDHANRN